jgi:hypothetical protein
MRTRCRALRLYDEAATVVVTRPPVAKVVVSGAVRCFPDWEVLRASDVGREHI